MAYQRGDAKIFVGSLSSFRGNVPELVSHSRVGDIRRVLTHKYLIRGIDVVYSNEKEENMLIDVIVDETEYIS